MAVLSIFAGSIHIYARPDFDRYARILIKIIFDLKQDDINSNIETKAKEAMGGNTSNVIDYIEASSDKVVRNVELYADEEVVRAGTELDAYSKELMKQLDEIMLEEEQRLQGVVTSRVDQVIDQLKQEILRDLTLELEKRFESQLNNKYSE